MADWKALLDGEFDLFEPINVAQSLIRIASVSGSKGEHEIARFIANYFIDHQVRVTWQEVEDGRANLLAEIQGALGEGPTLLLNGHLDTTPLGSGWRNPPLGGQILDNHLFGRGACDMKGALGAMVYAARMVSLFSHSLYGRLKLLFVVDEERDNAGMKTWIASYQESGEPVDFAVVGEPTDLNISLGHRGVAGFRVKVKGKAAHAGMAEQGSNAICMAADMIRLIESLNGELRKFADPDLGHPSLNVGRMQGGVSANVVPELCHFEIDARTLPDYSLDRLTEDLRKILGTAILNRPKGFTFDLEQSIPHLPPVKIPRNMKEIDILARSISDVPGEMPIFAPFPASCEASYLFGVGIPTLIFGPGRIEEAHGANEYVSITQVVAASRIYSLLALRFLGGG
ncbi:MAG TPA: M20 family metallopeptidase [Atribacteraceae bacterium]|nr:M20 family metallopeptidase [Atribacteraceae bacterium]